MKRFTLLLLVIILLLNGCKKSESSNQINGVTGISWQMFGMRKYSEMFLSPTPMNWYLKLNTDNTFTFSLHDSISTGTYTWSQIDSINALVCFSIQQWKASISDTAYTNRLKYILSNVDSCRYLNRVNDIYNPVGNFDLPPNTKGLWFYSDKGWAQVINY